VILCTVACKTQKPLYSWYDYDVTSYNYQKNADEASIRSIIETYQKIIEKQKGSRQTVPPGIYADYGFLLIQTEQVEKGKTMLMREIELYPESKPFIEKILKMIEQ
jgi:hypothetical protein